MSNDDEDGCLPIIIFAVIVFFAVKGCGSDDKESPIVTPFDASIESILNPSYVPVMSFGVPEKSVEKIEEKAKGLEEQVRNLDSKLEEYRKYD
jgi:hypothetical protein